ncbi:MAG: trigger factor [Candidatus Pelagibacterales bacterium]|nr:MAG: trigger factor [Pelagibacterales bacterium]
MKVIVDSKKGLKTNLKVFIDKKTIDEKMGARFVELSKTIDLKGFRPGKVPIDVLKRQFGKAVYGEVLEKILQETSAKAIEEKKIKVAGQPKLELKSHGEGKDLNYTLEIDELPEVKLSKLENIQYTDYEIKVTDGEIKKRIDDIAKNQDNFKDKNVEEVASNGDLVVFDYEATIENKNFEGGQGKNTQIVLGKDLFIKGFDKQLLGVKKNQLKEVEATLPENYPKKELVNKKAIFKCKILNIKKSEPVKIDNEFAKNLGAKDLNDLKELVKKQIQNQYKMSFNEISKEKILDQLEKLHNIEIPDNLLNQELSIITQNLKKEDIEKNKKNNEKIAKKRIKLGLLLNELGEKNNLKVEEKELRDEIQKQVQSMPGQHKQVLEYYQKNPSAAASLRGSIYEEKILNLIKNQSKKVKKEIASDEAEKILKAEHEKHHQHNHEHSSKSEDKIESKKPKKMLKSAEQKKKIRKK